MHPNHSPKIEKRVVSSPKTNQKCPRHLTIHFRWPVSIHQMDFFDLMVHIITYIRHSKWWIVQRRVNLRDRCSFHKSLSTPLLLHFHLLCLLSIYIRVLSKLSTHQRSKYDVEYQSTYIPFKLFFAKNVQHHQHNK